MKKILIAMVAMLTLQLGYAQDGSSRKSVADAKKNVEKTQAATQDEKKALKSATWTKYAKALLEYYNSASACDMMNQSKPFVLKYMEKDAPTKFKAVELKDGTFDMGSKNDVEYYFLKDVYVFYTFGDGTILTNALAAYYKALSLDSGKKTTEDAKKGVLDVAVKYNSEAISAYYLGDMKQASALFEKVADITEKAPVSSIDTASLAKACLASYVAKDYDNCARQCKRCMDINYYGKDNEIIQLLAESYSKIGKDAEAKEMLEAAYAKNPESKNLMFSLIDLYNKTGEDPTKLVALLDAAIEKSPDMEILYCLKGEMKEKLGQMDEALAEYRKAQALNTPEARGFAYEGQYFWNMAADCSEKANALDVKEYKKYNDMMAQKDEMLKQAATAYETCYNKSTDEKLKTNVANNLKTVFFNLRNVSPEYQASYEKFEKIVSGQ